MKLERIFHCLRSLWGLGWLALIAKDYQDHSVHYWLSILANEKKKSNPRRLPISSSGGF